MLFRRNFLALLLALALFAGPNAFAAERVEPGSLWPALCHWLFSSFGGQDLEACFCFEPGGPSAAISSTMGSGVEAGEVELEGGYGILPGGQPIAEPTAGELEMGYGILPGG